MRWIDLFIPSLAMFFHIEFDRCGNGRLSVYADTWERILCHHAEDSANTLLNLYTRLTTKLLFKVGDRP